MTTTPETASSPIPSTSGTQRPTPKALRSTAGKTVLSLTDQAFVSGARFATSILLGRYATQEDLGVYWLGFSLLILFTCVQESLITSPFTVLRVKRQGKQQPIYRGSVFVHYVGLALSSLLIFVIAHVATRNQSPALSMVLLALAASTPFALLREFARRVEFAQLHLGVATLVDATVAITQISILGWLAWTDRLTAVTATCTVGVASAASALTWLALTYHQVKLDRSRVLPDLRKGWELGRWVFLAQTTGLLHLQGMSWLVAAVLGQTATGLFAACTTVALFMNPLALGINNYVGPLAVRRFATDGLGSVRKLIGMVMLLIVLVIGVFSFGIFLAADPVMSLLYDHNPAYLGRHWLLLLLGLNICINAAHMICDGGVWAVERPQVIFFTTIIAVVVTFAAAAVLIQPYELIGAALSLLIGRLSGAIVQAAWFFIVLRPATLSGPGAARSVS